MLPFLLRVRLRSYRLTLPIQYPQSRRYLGYPAMAEEAPTPSAQPIDKLSMKDYRVYNSMAEHMEYFVFSLSKWQSPVG